MPTQFSQFIDGGDLVAGDRIVGLRNNLNTIFDPTFLTPVSYEITQPGHGFLVGELVYITGAGIFALANAVAPVTSNVIGMVIEIVDANHFILQIIGLTPSIITPPTPALVPGDVYFLSDAIAGAYTNVAPVTPGHVRKPVFIAYTTTTAFIFNYQGNIL